MGIPHYLVRASSGIWHYRHRMPRALFPLVQKTEIKRALGTRELGAARELALHLWRAYDELHTSMRALGMAGKSSVAEIIARLKEQGRHYRLVQKADGTIEVEALGAEDHAHAMDAVMRIGELHKETLVQHLLAHPAVAPNTAAAAGLVGPAGPVSLPAPSPAPAPVRTAHREPSIGLNGEPLAAKLATRAVVACSGRTAASTAAIGCWSLLCSNGACWPALLVDPARRRTLGRTAGESRQRTAWAVLPNRIPMKAARSREGGDGTQGFGWFAGCGFS